MLAMVGGAGAAGLVAGKALPVDRDNKQVASYAVAAVGAVAAAAVAREAKKKRDSAAVVDLYNAIVELEDPSFLTSDVVSGVGSKFGLNMQRDDLEGLTKIYGQYLEALIPSGDVQLKGDEAPKLAAFKDALGLSDEDAAPVHIEVARRLFRQGYESKDRNLAFEQRKAFQRLLYVSQCVFGDQRSAFLLPWRRHFNITEAQVFVARRDNARTIFRTYLEQQGGKLQPERHFLHKLREYQHSVKLMDETAAELIKDAARTQVEEILTSALTSLRATAKARDTAFIVSRINAALQYSRELASLANEDDLVPGLGPVTLAGGPFMAEGRSRDTKDLFRVFVEYHLEQAGQFTPQLEADTKDLQAMLMLTPMVARDLSDEVAATLYRRLLREEVMSGRLDSATAPAEVLGSLCDRLHFSPEAAMELHKSLYKSKLASLMEEKPALSAAEVADLARIQRILCLPTAVVKAVQKETVGRQLEDAISDIFMMGAKPVSEGDLQRIEALIKGLKLDSDVAMDVFKGAVRERLKAYAQQALKERGANQDRRSAAAALKKLVQFNAIVVTPLLEKVKGLDAAAKEIADIMAKAMAAAKAEGKDDPAAQAAAEAAAAQAATSTTPKDPVVAVKEAMQAARGEFGEAERKGQKEITMRDDISAENRALLYKEFLMQTMSGEVVELPVGGAIRRKVSSEARNADMARLQALSELLGMNQMEVAAVHSELAETAYKSQASEVLRSGPLSADKAEYLENMRTQLGLTKEQADKAMKAARTETFGSAAVAEEGGKWTLERITELAKSGGNVAETVDEATRRALFRREFERRVSDGTGDLDADYLMKQLPELLGLEERRIMSVAKELVGTRRRLLLVQAVSQHRQKNSPAVVTSLLDLLSCSRALPDPKGQAWGERSEIKEVYGVFCGKVQSSAKRAELATVLGLTPEEAAEAQQGMLVGAGAGGNAADDNASFF